MNVREWARRRWIWVTDAALSILFCLLAVFAVFNAIHTEINTRQQVQCNAEVIQGMENWTAVTEQLASLSRQENRAISDFITALVTREPGMKYPPGEDPVVQRFQEELSVVDVQRTRLTAVRTDIRVNAGRCE